MKDIDGQYLVTAYEQASDSWTTFLKDQKVADLHTTLNILCNAHRGLEEDAKFWAALHELPSDLNKHQKEVKRILADFDSFLALEEEIFSDDSSQIHLNGVAAARLTNDMNFVLRDVDLARSIVLQRPDALAIENLRKRSVNLQNAVCAARDDTVAGVVPPRRRFFRYARYGLKALQFVGGGAVIVMNTSALATGNIVAATAACSFFTGFKAMKDIVEEQLA